MKIEFIKNKDGIIINGPLLMTPKLFLDQRGIFMESWNKKLFNDLTGNKKEFVQDNYSISKKNILRGLHYQISPKPQGKLVKCVKGNIFDVVIDLRKNSKTFGLWSGFYLNDQNHKQIWIPQGFAHGFLTISDEASVIYKVDEYWYKNLERSIRWNDPNLKITWPTTKGEPILSAKDKEANLLYNLSDSDLFNF
ncbi:dTDP-4-dehydrorhamnose 3,5-epimerase [uncultured Prochlorococcus sp.]|uniref:dTDP-4-dehydrorhamnose 3,5-epimerase n=1 Tax=uncultured Prochlorococcus sp. TaxID=159733 RepID=UPI00258BB6F8|nr:dTDP-4-dehydrorhamnose 3,5-epimerase [uncultured Prochlorococcus sp.]